MIRDCNHYRFAASLQEIDAAGAMYFGHLLNRAHLAYEALMTCIGFSLEEILSQHGYRLPLVHCEADFLRPVQHGQQVAVVIRLEHLGNSSFRLGYRFLDPAGNLVARVKTVHCAIDAENGRPCPLEAPLRSALAPYRDAP